MVDEHEDQDGVPAEPEAPSLEPPSLFRRKARAPKAPKAPKPPEPPKAAPRAPEVPAPAVEAPVPDRSAPVRPSAWKAVQSLIAAPAQAPEPVVTAEPTVAPPVQPAEPAEPTEPTEPAEPREPWLVGRVAALVAGLVVGALLVAGTAASLKVCDVVRGTETCGGSGYLFLIAILVVAALVGGALLRAAGVPDPVPTAILAVGLLAVFSLLFLVGHLLAWWMVVVIPLVSVGAFVLSHWVTTSFADLDE